jgi:hypothetical protein
VPAFADVLGGTAPAEGEIARVRHCLRRIALKDYDKIDVKQVQHGS